MEELKMALFAKGTGGPNAEPLDEDLDCVISRIVDGKEYAATLEDWRQGQEEVKKC